ncbi:hypothetical protein Hypma_013479 [Hypsizygus marmoreus]|uniref:F-box domain-containing protein n=1 Tax=Hypsizygus marmoreus TaxID=39966 RepID=A0A369JDV5_HYPMA|nr:hypothetical protein Hypma_013479 [Hypsizygus marmoreus]
MPIATLLGSHLPAFLLSRFKRNSPCYILRLSLDIHVDHIFIYLRVEDILALRRVNKAFFLLTHEPIIWKRFLAHLSIPIPPLRPTFRYALEATDYEVEQLVSRAISLEDNWRRQKPKVTRADVFLAHYNVLDLKLLPGGKYLIASVKDSSSYRFFIVVFCLDHPKGPHAMARLPTRARAYYMQAKYMKYQGQDVIMLAYVIRTFEDGGPANVDPSEYSARTKIDPPHPFHHELNVAYISLNSLEAMANPHIVPGDADYTAIAQRQKGPFFQLATIVGTLAIDTISLFEMRGSPFVSLIQQPDNIAIFDAVNNAISILVCHEHQDHRGKRHFIRAVRALPYQDELLVIRSVQTEGFFEQFLEIYDMPTHAEHFTPMYPKAQCSLGFDNAFTVHISDYGIPSKNGESNYSLRHDLHPSPPISIYLENIVPSGINHFVVWPNVKDEPATKTRPATRTYFYDLEHVQQQTRHISEPHRVRVLPGAYRAIVYTVQRVDTTDTPSVVMFKRYLNPEVQTGDYPIPRVSKSTYVLRRDHPPFPHTAYTALDLDPHIMETYQRGGVQAISWDEGIGRVCVATGNSDQIEILDFAHVVQADQRFAQWKRNQDFVLHDTYDSATGLPIPVDWR